MNRREIGKEKEQYVCGYLKDKGYHILHMNYWCRYSEIDIVAKDGDYLVFIEVKYRKDKQCGGSIYAVSQKKMRNISECARYYIYREHIAFDTPMRFDVIAIDSDQITHIENAFEYKER